MPKSKAVKGLFVFDPEHGGGRRRRDKHCPRTKIFTENTDKIEYNKDLNKCFEIDHLSEDENCGNENPFAMAAPTDRSNNQAAAALVESHTEFNCFSAIAHPENIEDDDE